ncbi:uncharacterized protein LACBIDRAFT_296259 [Laccaria bicolor S238N-H82]|uniref:Predicted protein n=1 Tax=Laccaria bicolor (strain S238N-H82 / ATCC MYA-4686) TaxID=486041 RepID=B0D8C4_LACBS|nr:uncharacterized protein LACBIDRAFT_296259 [Laccaria bicolor S238N-H82]EDR08811.1 predicted protein [Laccaria bicolor S238N-H82]|eukprot:XP_001880124.1 predicted protein [Laccaria bicolor S238N-H82]
MPILRAFAVISLAAYASAQSLSSACTTALTSVALNPDAAACLSPSSLIPIATGGANKSVVAPINNWLTAVCGAPACSNATIAAVVTNITTGCATDLAATGFTSDLTPTITTLVEQYYPTVRQVICLKDGSTNCITETLTNIEAIVGPLTLTNILSIAANPPSTIPTNITCSNCIKAAYNIIAKDVPSIVSEAAPALQSQCGASFTDGATPSGISESATNAALASTSSKAAAAGSVAMLSQGLVAGLAASGLVIGSTLFTLLA